MSDVHASDRQSDAGDDKFAFGRNWSKFLKSVNEDTIHNAEESLQRLLLVDDLQSKVFIDAGSGSGLFSIAAYNLGATVVSFDADPDCVRCTNHLRNGVPEPDRWTVLDGSLLDSEFLASLPRADFVYCWGVAHHTGDMWRALEQLAGLVTPQRKLVIAIYNDQQYVSRAWFGVKRIYQRLPSYLRLPYVLAIWLCLFIRRAVMTLAACALRLLTLRNPFAPVLNWVNETRSRGMHSWYDLVDWIGGWPFEVARPEEIFRFMRDRGFMLREMTTSGGHGCNEFMFVRTDGGN